MLKKELSEQIIKYMLIRLIFRIYEIPGTFKRINRLIQCVTISLCIFLFVQVPKW